MLLPCVSVVRVPRPARLQPVLRRGGGLPDQLLELLFSFRTPSVFLSAGVRRDRAFVRLSYLIPKRTFYWSERQNKEVDTFHSCLTSVDRPKLAEGSKASASVRASLRPHKMLQVLVLCGQGRLGATESSGSLGIPSRTSSFGRAAKTLKGDRTS